MPADDRVANACDADNAVAYAFVDRVSRPLDDGPCVWCDVAELVNGPKRISTIAEALINEPSE